MRQKRAFCRNHPGHVIPFTVPVTPEGAELLQSITEDNKVVELENADFELVE